MTIAKHLFLPSFRVTMRYEAWQSFIQIPSGSATYSCVSFVSPNHWFRSSGCELPEGLLGGFHNETQVVRLFDEGMTL